MQDVTPATPVSEDEPLARYTHQENYRKSDLRPKRQMFSPPPNQRLSVFRVIALDEGAKIKLGQSEYGDKLNPPRKILGWSEFKARILRLPKVNLTFVPGSATGLPSHPRHGDIIGWPSLIDPESKAKEMAIASALAEYAGRVIEVS